MQAENQELRDKLAALREGYAQQLPQKLTAGERLVERLARQSDDPDLLEETHRYFHGLGSSAAQFGFPAVSAIAREIEHIAQQAERAGKADEESLQSIRTRLTRFHDAMDVRDEPLPEPGLVPRKSERTHQQKLSAYILEDDNEIAYDLGVQLGYYGYQVNVFTDAENFKFAVAERPPSVIVSDVYLGARRGPEVVREVNEGREHPIPALFISGMDDMQTHLQVVRAGGAAFFPKPLDIPQLIDRLDTLTMPRSQEPYRILIVDDDASMTTYYRAILEGAGMCVETLNDPLQILEPLAEFNPDLVLLDMYMPNCSGVEIGRIIRQRHNYVGMPIMFLSSETDPEIQRACLQLGAEDFLNKSTKTDHLLSMIGIRIERARTLRALMRTDGLTGLLNHSTLKERLQSELTRARRTHAPLCLAMLDIDHFKKVNDTYGHLVGDRVIKSLARLLRQRLRGSDIIGRYGGEEFAVIMPDTELGSAHSVMETLRRSFANIQQTSDSESFSVTFSCGIATYPPCGSAMELNDLADKALYVAKNAGRNRISPHPDSKTAEVSNAAPQDERSRSSA